MTAFESIAGGVDRADRHMGAIAPRPGIVRLGVICLQSALERTRPADVRSSLIATLFGRASNVAMVALAAIVCGLTAYVRLGHPAALAFTALEVALLLARCAMILAFKRAEAASRLVDAEGWLVAFGAAAIGSSVLWGLACFICLAASHDPVLYVLPVLSTVGTAGAVAARNSGVPRLAKFQLTVSLVPIMAGSVFADDKGYALLCILVPAMLVGLLILIAERNEQLVALIVSRRELARLSRTDPLTGVANRREFADVLDLARRRMERGSRSFAVVMVDVDHFKSFNDLHGHPAGDACLQTIARILEANLRSAGDVVARYGGEEFALLLCDIDMAAAQDVAARVCAHVAAWGAGLGTPAGVSPVTVSCGVAVASAANADGASLIKAADEALYRAKALGRNRVECFDLLLAA